MAIRNVAAMGNPVLRKKASPVPPKAISTPEIQGLLQDMVDTMFEYDGLGLAAPQVHESLQIVVMMWDFDKGKKPRLVFLINPEIKILTEETSEFWEGCLSVPGLRGLVKRATKIHVKALDEKGKDLDFIAEGFAATVIQHECDHLDGTLYVDRIEDTTKFSFNKEYSRYHTDEGDGDGGVE